MTTPATVNSSEQVAVICKRSLHGTSLWTTLPTSHSVIVYSVAVPVASVLGIVGNALILRVLCDGNFKASVFTYLTVLAAADIVTCSMLLFSGLARGVFWCQNGWLEFDVFVYLPVVSISSNVTVFATMLVAVDRLATVFSLDRCEPPKFCDHRVARKLTIFTGCSAVLINIPYCFIYTYNGNGDLVTTSFFHSWWYDLQEWLKFVVFAMIPTILLLVANIIMCQSVKKTLRKRQSVLQGRNVREGNRLRDQARMTVMLVGIVFTFLIGEVPTYFTSRLSALTLLYGGDPTKVPEYWMERFRMYATLLSAISSSANFVLYCLLNRRFLSNLKRLLIGNGGAQRRRSGTVKRSVPRRAAQQIESSDIIANKMECANVYL